MVITRSVAIKPGTYRLPAPGDAPLITVRGSNITVDPQGAVLEGADPESDPDGAPVLTERARRLDYINGRALRDGLPADGVALVAEARLVLPPGPDDAYLLRVISDDGVRVWVDGRLVVDNWDVHGSEIDTARMSGGAHTLKVEYFEATGWAELRLDFARVDK